MNREMADKWCTLFGQDVFQDSHTDVVGIGFLKWDHLGALGGVINDYDVLVPPG